MSGDLTCGSGSKSRDFSFRRSLSSFGVWVSTGLETVCCKRGTGGPINGPNGGETGQIYYDKGKFLRANKITLVCCDLT